MQKKAINIIMLLLFSTAVLSCSMDLSDMNGYSLEISGKVMDKESSTGIEDIRITVEAMRNNRKLYDKNAYTDNNGEFVILLDGGQKPTSVIVTADDTDAEYESSRQELIITWDSSHNIKDGTFIINDCNFHLSKTN